MKTSDGDQIYSTIGDRVRQYREVGAMSQQTLAEAVGFQSGTAISLIESGGRRVSIGDLKTIAEKLDVTLPTLLGEEPKIDFKVALRSDNDLTTKDKEQVIDFYKFLKQARKRGGDD